ncbi:MAG: glycosyltransferase family 39 protein, partial [Gammaproteobacteria bacterium]|nr:glycosyltransferase family 39 protein [Gammaproteobacteria bacterium]
MKNNDFNDKILKLKSIFNLDLLFILFIFILSFYIRAVLPHEAVFRGGIVGFAADDAVYHMRLVENLVKNFPHKIWFDVFTLYPSGQYLHFGPLWTYMIAISSLILGFGAPSLELTRSVGAYFPAIFGALLVFPIYFIGKEVFDRRVGLISAFIVAVMPGQILSRSVMGFSDHHIGEVFFSSLYL